VKEGVIALKRQAVCGLADCAADLQVLAQAFGQEGIPHQIIRDIVPELEASANEILGRMTGGRMRLEFRTERALKSNKGKEVATLEIVIIDSEYGELPYLSRSGGQKTRCSLAVIFALAILKASRVGMQLGFLFIDEPAGLDEEGIDGYCSALESIHSMYPDMRIVAISHDERMKARFAQQLFVEVTENGSKVRRT
jgi:exonuclease SbcC